MKVANKHKIYLVDADVMISKSQSREMEQNREGISSKKKQIWICATLTELIVAFGLGEKVGIKDIKDKEWI